MDRYPPLVGSDEHPRETARLLDDQEVEAMEAEEERKKGVRALTDEAAAADSLTRPAVSRPLTDSAAANWPPAGR